MKKANYFSMGALVLVLAAVLGIGVLAGCAQGGTDDAATTEKQEATADAGDEKTDDAAADTEKTADDGPVWVMTRQTNIYTDKASETKTTDAIVYELDEHGNAVKYHLESDSSEGGSLAVTTTFDENGYMKSSTGVDGKEVTYTQELDENGRLTKLVGSDGTVRAFTYNEDGNIEVGSVSGPMYGEDTDGNVVESGAYTVTNTYDADGFVAEYRSEGDTTLTITYSYERDANDKIIGYTATYKTNGADDMDIKYTVEFDDNGNVTRVLEDGEGYSMENTYEYVQVEDPSAWVRANAHIKAI